MASGLYHKLSFSINDDLGSLARRLALALVFLRVLGRLAGGHLNVKSGTFGIRRVLLEVDREELFVWREPRLASHDAGADWGLIAEEAIVRRTAGKPAPVFHIRRIRATFKAAIVEAKRRFLEPLR